MQVQFRVTTISYLVSVESLMKMTISQEEVKEVKEAVAEAMPEEVEDKEEVRDRR